MRGFSLRQGAGVLCALVLVGALTAQPALATGQGLPRSYSVQRVDTPLPVLASGIGYPLIAIGDVNGDGKDDIASSQTTGSPNNDGVLFIHSGATGQIIDTLNAPDPGGAGQAAVIDRFMDKLLDIGSCPNPPPASDPDQTCDSASIGPPDGIDEIMMGAEGVDVGGVTDVGRVWVIDGATRAVLKRIDMPPADRAVVAARQAQFPTAGVRGGFGRTVGSPRGLPPCAGNGGVGACLSTVQVPVPVRIGDMDRGGRPDIVVGANRFPETAATAHPASHCAASGATLCNGAGRVYVYRGEDIAGSSPTVNLDGSGPGQTPPKIIKSLAAQNDALETTELLGHAQMPVGDVGVCRTTPPFPPVSPGEKCLRSSSTNVPDGTPDFVVAAHRADYPIENPEPANIEVGASFLIDGATGSVLHTYLHPEPQASAFFGYTLHQTFALGDLGGTALPDLVLPAMGQNVQNHYGVGRAYVIDGNFRTTDINPALLNDPTPTTGGYFGVPTEGVGDLVPELPPRAPRNEVVVGAFGFNAGRANALTDVHFFSPLDEQLLQTISDPDQQQESGFGYAIVPLGDLNGDGFLDLAVGSPRWDIPGVGGSTGTRDVGRFYIFRSDNTPRGGGGGGGSGDAIVRNYPTPTPAATLAGCPAGKRLLALTSANEKRNGTAGADLILAGAGNDTIDALAGDDCVDLGLGNDRGQGGLGRDLVLGGGGVDRILGNDGEDTLRGGAGIDTILGGFGDDLMHGQSGNDRATGSRGRDRINGGSGRDSISAGSGHDRAAGDQGNDRINGNSGNDVLFGNSGTDLITGGAGADRISAGAGGDRINARDGRRDRVNCGRGRDRVVADRADRVARNCERVLRR